MCLCYMNENRMSDESYAERSQNPCRRRRSSSLVSRKNRNNILKANENMKYLQKYASSGNLFYNSNIADDSDSLENSIGLPIKINTDNAPFENLFVNWFKDPKSVKNQLSKLYENNIFKTGFLSPENFNYDDFFPPVMFLVSSNLKIDCEYEIYTIKNYDVRLSEFMSWAFEKKPELYDEYHNGFKAINQKVVDIANTDFDHDEKEKLLDEETKRIRRHWEIMGLMIVNKNQQISTFLPNKTSNSYDVVNKIGDVILIDQARSINKCSRHIILSNDVLSIFATKKAERLKYKFSLKHMYCGRCSDHQIPNIDSSLRIGGPFGDDIILTFSNPNCRNEWNIAIQNSISACNESFKQNKAKITILKNLETNFSAPLISKSIETNGRTTGLELKKKALEEFGQNDKSATDFILTFHLNGSNREYILHDDVSVMVLQEHIGCFGDSSTCTEYCFNVGKANVLSRTHFYLKYNPAKEIAKIKKPKIIMDVKITKNNQYSLNEKWVDNVIPEWLMILLSDIYYEGSQVEGIFRLPGNKSKSDNLIQIICGDNTDIEIKEEINTKANILKKFLKAIEGSIFTNTYKEKLIALSNEIISLDDFKNNTEQIKRILNIVQSLPRNNHNILQYILVIIDQIKKNEEINKMSLSNLAVCLGPTIMTNMNESSAEDFLKTNTLFECLLSIIDKIVDDSSKQKIVQSLKKRRTSIKPDDNLNKTDEVQKKSVNAVEDVTHFTSQRKLSKSSLTPRENKSCNEIIIPNNFDITNSNETKQKYDIYKKKIFQDMRNSLSEELPIDHVDSLYVPSEPKSEKPNMIGNVRMRPLQRTRKSRECNTITIVDEDHSTMLSRSMNSFKDNAQSPFHRQNQVNRKFRDNSASRFKLNEDEQKVSKVSVQALPKEEIHDPSPKLVRNIDRTILDKESRYKDRIQQSKPLEKSQQVKGKFVFNSKLQNPDHKRSSSQSRVHNIIQEYEKKLPEKLDSSSRMGSKAPQKIDKEIKDMEIGNKIIRNNNVITRKQNIHSKVGPIRPIYDGTHKNVTQIKGGRSSMFVQRSNTIDSSMQKTSEEKEDCYI